MKSHLWIRVAQKIKSEREMAEQQQHENNIDFYRELSAILNCFFFSLPQN